jgi:hypothetical protein
VSRRAFLVVALGLMAADPASAQPIHLDGIVEIRGYPPPPEVQPGATQSVDTPPIDFKGQALRAFLSPYVPVRNEDVVARAFSSASATAVFRDGVELSITFMYASCPWETASLGMIAGQPQMLAFVVEHDFVMFQLRNLCGTGPKR